jgi:long-chain acyl-CoA synthetase
MIELEKMTLNELCRAAARKFGKRRAFQIFRDGKVYDIMSYRDWELRSLAFAARLRALGLAKGSRVMILAENCPEWAAAWFGIALAGMVSVPVLTEFMPEQIETIAAHAEISACCVTGGTAAKAAGLDPSVSLIGIDKREDPLEDPPEPIPEYADETEGGDLAAIVYTSGTTGASKGVMLSHRNLVSCAMASRSLMKIYPRDRLLSVIPLAHTYECTLGLVAALISGASVTYLDKPPAPSVLLPAIQAIRPTAMLTVPLFIEKIYRQKIAPALRTSPLYRFPPTRPLAVQLAGLRLLSALGGAIRFFGIGGAPLAPDVEDFLKKIKFPYAPGYGLTEAAPLLAGTAPYKFPLRSSGTLLKGVHIRIAANGEIQAQGPNVMMGYYRNEEETKRAFTEDGWLKTGDLGVLDKKGRLYIRGRIKALILGPSGENIYPEEIEGLLTSSDLVDDAIVRSGARGEIVALVVLSEKAKTFVAALGDTLEELKRMVNKRLAAFSRINRIEIQTEPFEKTPTLKIRRFLYQGE